MTRHPLNRNTHPSGEFRGLHVLIMGLGRFGGGVAVSRWLTDQGAKLTVTDLSSAETLADSLSQIADLDADLRLGGHDGVDPGDFDLVIVNPAVIKRRSDLFQRIELSKTPWTTEMNLFCLRCPAKVVGVTGSYGKSTTCAMLAGVLNAAVENKTIPFRTVHLGGNIGRPLLSDLDRIHPRDLVVLEMSNAQLEDLPRIDWTPSIAAITNLWPHHLDRYDSERDYYDAKINIARTPSANAPLFVGDMHPRAQELINELVFDAPGRLVRVVSPEEPIDLSVPGKHNRQNAATVLTICKHLGIHEQFVRKKLRGFSGLPDRLERVCSHSGVTFVNDSKSTAPTATMMAVRAIRQSPQFAHGRLLAIVGGKRKNTDFSECATQLVDSCDWIICMGESAPIFEEAIKRAMRFRGSQDSARIQRVNTLEQAVVAARQRAHQGDVVLFSPGAPSFDAYVNYAARGDHFRTLVKTLSSP